MCDLRMDIVLCRYLTRKLVYPNPYEQLHYLYIFSVFNHIDDQPGCPTIKHKDK